MCVRNFRHDRHVTTFRAPLRITAHTVTCSSLIGTPNCVPWPKPLVVPAGLPWWLNFNAHTHPMSTEKPVGIPTESPYLQNPEILHTRTLHPVYFCLMHISFYFLSCMPSVCSIIVCTQYCTAWCMNIRIQYVQIKLSITVYNTRHNTWSLIGPI